MQIRESTILITGASSGIGAAFAQAAAQHDGGVHPESAALAHEENRDHEYGTRAESGE